MKSFKDLGITSTTQSFVGDKIEIYNVMNREIIVNKFKIEPSKYPEKGNGKRLTLQIIYEDRDRIVFTGSGILMDMVAKVQEEDFPFTTTIVKENKGYKFT